MRVSHNVLWNTLAVILPILVGLAVVPLTLEQLGTERFGVLSGIWMLIGYLSVFDLGLGRTLTKMVADRLAENRDDLIPPIASTTLIVIAISGVVMSLGLLLGANPIARAVTGTTPALVSETAAAVRWVALGLPFVLLATALVGLLEGFQKFALIGAVRVPMGILTYVMPLAVLPFWDDLGAITAVLAVLRIVTVCALAWLSLRVLPALRGRLLVFRRDLVRSLLTFGGWLTVSNVVGPVMVYFDRFLIASVLGSAAVAYYTVPYDVVTRLWVFPMAMQGVLFPTFILLRGQSLSRTIAVFERSSEMTLLLLTPALIAVMLLAYEGLQLWVGPEFADKSSTIAKALMIGVLANALARAPFTLVQGAGHASWTAVVHLLELPVYALALWFCLSTYGADGAAYAWSARMVIDAMIFYVLAVKIEPGIFKVARRDMLGLAGVCTAGSLLSLLVSDLLLRGLIVLTVGAICGAFMLGQLRGVLPSILRRRALNSG